MFIDVFEKKKKQRNKISSLSLAICNKNQWGMRIHKLDPYSWDKANVYVDNDCNKMCQIQLIST